MPLPERSATGVQWQWGHPVPPLPASEEEGQEALRGHAIVQSSTVHSRGFEQDLEISFKALT